MRKVVLFILAVLLTGTMYGQLTGIKTIPGDYATIAAAVTDLNTVGVGFGGVTFNVASGYTENITDPILITATGTVGDPILFQKSGATANPLVTRTDAGTLSTSTLGGQGDAVFILQGSDYITFDRIDVAASNSGIEYGFYFRKASVTDGCKFNTIKNSVITMTKGTSAYVIGIYASNNDALSTTGSATGITITTTGGRNENLTFTGNTIGNVFAGIVARGYNHTSAPYDFYDQNLTIGALGEGNTIQNYAGNAVSSSYGVYMIYQTSPNISYNTINNAGGGGTNATSTLYGIFMSTSSAGGDFVANNNAITLGISATSGAHCIYNAQKCNSININNNSFSYGTFASTTTSYLIYCSNATNNITITGNQTLGAINKTGAGQLEGYYNFGSPTGGTASISSNNFSNITLTGASTFYGIRHYTSTTQVIQISNNTVSNITGGTSAMYGIYQGYGAAGSYVMNNTVTNLTGSGAIYGLYLGASTAPVSLTASGNSVNGLSTSGASTIYGVFNNLGTSNLINKNMINNLAASNASGVVYGIYVSGGASTSIVNNFICDLRVPAANAANPLAGIYVSGGTTSNIFFNTVYLNATSSGALFGSSAIYTSSTPTVDLRNNIFINNSTPKGAGYTSAYRRSSTTLTSYSGNSNNNNFYAGVPGANNVIFYDGTNNDQTLAAYQTRVAPRDAVSVTENSPFVNVAATPYDLHMQTTIATLCESGGNAVTTPIVVTDDYDGNARSATPDIGADEFAGIPAGVINPGGFAASAFSSTQIDLTFTPNIAGNNVVIVWNLTGAFTPPAGAPPAPGNAFAGGTVLYNGLVSPVNHTGLTPQTPYFYKAFSYDGASYSSGATASATTLCATINAFPWNEGFEGLVTVGTNIFPACWAYTNITSTNYSCGTTCNSNTAHTGTKFIGGSWSFDVWHFTPGFDLTAGTSYDFSYWFKCTDAVVGYNVSLHYGAAQTVGSMTNTLNTETGLNIAVWTQRTFTFTPASSGTYYFGLHNACPTSSPNGIGFDDFSLALTPPMSYVSSTTAQSNTNQLSQGSTNQQILDLQIVTSGTTSPLSASSFTFNTNGSTNAADISNARLWSTGTSAVFATTTQLGNVVVGPSGSFTINAGANMPYTLAGGTNYFWLTYDITPGAAAGNVVDGEWNSVTVGGTDYIPTVQAPAGTRLIKAPLNGVYTIGASQVSPNYTNLTTAFNDLNFLGVSGPVTFQLAVDYSSVGETFPLTINAYPGASAVNTFTLRPAAGIAGIISGSSATALVKLYGADYVSIDGVNAGGSSLTFNNSNSAGVDIWLGSTPVDGATLNTVKNCTFLGNSGTTTVAGFLAGSGTTLGSPAEAANANNTVQNNSFKSTQNGIYIFGVATNDPNWIIANNTFGSTVAAEKHGYRGMLIGNASNFTISDNTIIGVQSSTTSSATTSGIQLAGTINGGEIYRNLIGSINQINTTGWGSAGIFLGATSTSSNVNIFNNIIYDVTGYGYAGVTSADNGYGFMINTGGGYNLYYNVVNMNTSQTAAGSIVAAINIAAGIATANSLILKNNIFNIPSTNTVGTRYAIYSGAANTVYSDIDNNNYYSVGTLGYLSSAQATIANWRTATGKDANSVNIDPAFVSGSDVHTVVPELNNGGATVGGITTDFSSMIRTNPPDIGAYEFTLPMVFITTTAATAIGQNTATVNAMVNTNNEVAATSFDYGLTNGYGSIGAGSPSPLRALVATPFSSDLAGLIPNTTYHYRAKGSSSTSAEVLNGIDMTFVTLPAPTIAGSTTPCPGVPGNIYTTEAGNTGYNWTIIGGTINSGNGTNSVDVTWNFSGPQSISVNYNNSAGFPAPVATVYNVTVKAMPDLTTAPLLSTICSGVATNIPLTSSIPGATYTWTASASSGMVSGYSAGSGSTISQTLHSLSLVPETVTYAITVTGDGCTATSATNYVVTVNPVAGKTFGGPGVACVNVPGNFYLTDGGMTNYVWNVVNGTIDAGGTSTDNFAVITWTSVPAGSVHVNYTNTFGCPSLTGVPITVTVNPVPVPTIAGSASICTGATGLIYTTEAGMTGYTWTVSAGGVITAGAGTNAITVTWNTAGPQTVSVNYTNAFGCTAASATVKNVTVNPLPVPIISGLAAVCIGSTGVTYSTEGGMSGYIWTISAGGTITSGAGTNSITVNWNVAGPQTLSVNYTNGNGCTATSATVKNVTVSPLPVPTITGSASGCMNTPGNIYTTEAGMTSYIWVVSAGGTVTAGGTAADNSVTVTWSGAGTQTISVSYTSPIGCAAAVPTVKTVTINPLPSPTLSGNNDVCMGSTNVYTTEALMNGYSWIVSAGGTIIAGGGAGDNTATVTWMASGPQTVSVNYNNAFGCTAITPTLYNVDVNTLPVPTIGGTNSLCIGSTGNVYATQAGMTNYTWVVSAGGVITSGGGAANNTVTVTWNAAGAQFVSVNYTNPNNCAAAVPTVYAVTVHPTPTPTLAGNANVCVGSTGNVYTTQAGQSNYSWSVSAGGTITAGGTPTSSTVTVTWATTGAKTVSVNYTSAAGCLGGLPAVYNVTVNPLPVPTLGGPNNICNNPAGNVYTTEAGMSNYIWNVSAGGTITSGGTTADNTVTVTWSIAGAQTVSVNYTNGNGCNGASATVFAVNVNALPVPTIAGNASACIGTTGVVYTTEAGMSNYTWIVSAGGTITAGGGVADNTVTVTWSSAGPQTVSVNYANLAGCSGAAATVKNVTVNPLPVPSLAGPALPCLNGTGNVYTTELGMTNYVWNVSAGGVITSGGTPTSNSVTVTWTSVGAQTVSVSYTNGNGCVAAAPAVYPVTVGPMPAPTIAGATNVCLGASGVVYTTEAGMTNYAWNISAGGTITAGGTPTSNTVTVTWNVIGIQSVSVNYTNANGCSATASTLYGVMVEPAPTPTIAGPATVCQGASGVIYSTESGMTSYVWTISAGGIITAGLGSNVIQVTWNSAGVRNVSVNYTSATGCPAGSPTVKSVTVVNLPTPTISGPWVICAGTAGNVYTTEVGQSGYSWNVSAGGFITAGAGTNQITVTWLTAGIQSVTVNYANAYGCFGAAPSTYIVNVEPQPTPTITGPITACAGSVGNVYVTQGGMTSYIWSISAGGTITSGAGTNSITVSWNTAGAQSVSVSYINAYGCSSAAPGTFNVNVAPMVPPSISGPVAACINSAGHVYTTEVGMTGYTWVVSAGGTITAGAGTDAITVTWNSAGAQTVTVNYTNVSGCTAAVPTTYNVTVNPLPVPTLAGPATACVSSTGNIYTTEGGMTGYNWTVSAGGTVTAGGTGVSNTVTVTWSTTGAQTVSVNYTNGNGCTAVAPVVNNVTVNPLPVPTIAGPGALCAGTTGSVYTTEPGMSGYNWNISAGGTVTAGAGTNAITVTWNSPGVQTVSVNYTNTNGCTAAAATVYNVTVNALPAPTITGNNAVCVNSGGNVYTTQIGMTGYNWIVSAGGIITAGAGTNAITVTWNMAGAQTVSVNYTNPSGCTAVTPTVYNVTVNPLPTPTITGPTTVCAATTGNVYSTEAGMSNYAWVVSAGGTITSGGTSTSNTVVVTWNTPGAQTVIVNYTNGNGCTAAAPTVYNVTVNALPTPTLAGPASVCVNSTGNVYTTQAGMTNYTWSVSPGGIVTNGGTSTSNTVTVTWSTTGAQYVRINYTNAGGCTAATYTEYAVTVNPLPVPTIAGPATVCANTTGNVYTTQSGMSGYTWTVSAGGTITAGAGTNAITVTWNAVGAQTVAVNYTNSNGCSAAAATVYNVTINPRPNPSLTGIAAVCAGTTGVVYTTDPGMTGYTWTVSAGGTITAGAGTNTITVTWNTAGVQSVSVNYNNIFGCQASTATSLAVTVNALPVPTITGPASVCLNSAGNVYTTQAGMSNYVWTVSAGGTITAGGTSTSNTVTVTWTTTGAKTVCVTYTNASGCTASVPTCFNVTVNTAPVPTITGSASMCVNSGYYNYTTEAGMSNYVWTISAGGIITFGQGSNVAQVTWNVAGPQWIAVNYTNVSGCSSPTPTTFNVTVNPMPGAAGNIVGPATVCGGAQGIVYSVGPIANAVTYVWTLPAGATIVAGYQTNTITVDFASNASSGDITVYGDNLCGSGALSPPFAVTLTALPEDAGIISGDTTVCQGTTGAIYTVAMITNATGYAWSVPTGATIVAGANTHTITVNFATNANSGIISVHGTNSCGSGVASPDLNVTVSPIPPTPIITQVGDSLLMSNIPNGNQWYFAGAPIPGATGQYLYITVMPGEYWCVVTWNDCTSDTSIHIVLPTGITDPGIASAVFNAFPVPNDGHFTVSIAYPNQGLFNIKVYNNLGVMVTKLDGIEVNGYHEQKMDLTLLPDGLYTLIFENGTQRATRKLIITK